MTFKWTFHACRSCNFRSICQFKKLNPTLKFMIIKSFKNSCLMSKSCWDGRWIVPIAKKVLSTGSYEKLYFIFATIKKWKICVKQIMFADNPRRWIFPNAFKNLIKSSFYAGCRHQREINRLYYVRTFREDSICISDSGIYFSIQ